VGVVVVDGVVEQVADHACEQRLAAADAGLAERALDRKRLVGDRVAARSMAIVTSVGSETVIASGRAPCSARASTRKSSSRRSA
jgi:hypothetical protein